MLLQWLFAFLTISTGFVNTELFTALVEMEELLDTEAVLIGNLESYIKIQEQKLQLLKR